MMKEKAVSSLLAVCLFATVLVSCTKTGKEQVVREDDPWFESTRFELDTDQKATEMMESSIVSYCNGKVYHLYSLTNLADYDDYRRTMLTTYDEHGNELSSIRLEDPVNYVLSSIIAVRPDADGKTLEAAAEVFAPGYFANAICKIDIESGKVTSTKLMEKEPGKPLELSAGGKDVYGVSDVYSAGEYYFPVIYEGSLGGEVKAHIYSFRGAEYITELDLTGVPAVHMLEEFSYDSRSKTVLTIGYTMTDGAVVLEFDPETGKRTGYEKYNVQGDGEVNLAEYRAVTTGELYKIDMLGNITTFDIQTQEEVTVIDNNWYTPYFSDLTEESNLVYCDSSKAVIQSSVEEPYSMFFAGTRETVTILTKADSNPHAGKKVIELATPVDKGMSEYLSNAVYEFNRTDNEYLIRVWSKYKTGIVAGRDLSILNADDEKMYTMIQELKGDEAPDIAIGIQKQYAMRDDIFENLDGYLEQDVLDRQFSNIIEASRFGGKQYFLPVTIEIEGLVTDKSLIGDGVYGITFEDYDRMVNEQLDGFSPYDYPFSECFYKKDFILSCIDVKAAVEGDRVDFGTEQFRAAVEYSNEHFVQDGFTKPADFEWDEETARVRGSCRYDKIGSYIDFIHACKDEDGNYTIIGTPSVDASGPRFRALETISVTSASGVKDGAKKFLNFLFAGAGYSGSSKEFQCIVTNKETMARNMSMITEKNNDAYAGLLEMADYMTGIADDAALYGYKYAGDSLGDSFFDCLSALSRYYYDDPVITAFLTEEIGPYYAGDRSLDDVIKILNDRSEKYIKEM